MMAWNGGNQPVVRQPAKVGRGVDRPPAPPEERLDRLLAALALARIMAGETPGCPTEAKIAMAHVYQRNPVWYGNAEPTATDVAVSLVWQTLPDPTNGARFFVGPGDAPRMPWLQERTARWECAATWVEAWR